MEKKDSCDTENSKDHESIFYGSDSCSEDAMGVWNEDIMTLQIYFKIRIKAY